MTFLTFILILTTIAILGAGVLSLLIIELELRENI